MTMNLALLNNLNRFFSFSWIFRFHIWWRFRAISLRSDFIHALFHFKQVVLYMHRWLLTWFSFAHWLSLWEIQKLLLLFLYVPIFLCHFLILIIPLDITSPTLSLRNHHLLYLWLWNDLLVLYLLHFIQHYILYILVLFQLYPVTPLYIWLF